jgi:hypothetical protein
MADWITQPGCDKPSLSFSPSDLENPEQALKTGLKNAWNILKAKCTASSPGFPDFLYSIPNGTILRDPDSGHALLITQQGWKSIPTGGDYLCFTGQGDPVVNLPGLDSVTQGLFAGEAVCTSTSPPALSVDPNGGAGTLGNPANPQGPTANPQTRAPPPTNPPPTNPPPTNPPPTNPPPTNPPPTNPPPTDPPPPKPTVWNLQVGIYGGGHVGVSYDVGWQAGRDPITCHFIIDGGEAFTAQCGTHSSKQFYGISAGNHTFYAYVTDQFGVASDPTPSETRYVS